MALNTYYDNAATSFPKPPAVSRRIAYYLNELGGPYGRSAYQRAFQVSRSVEETRDRLAGILGTDKAENIIFTFNATHAINTVLNGMDLADRRILISPLEHNSVYRTIHAIKKRKNTAFDILPHFKDGLIRVEKIKEYLNKATALVVINHQSNVNGVIQPIREIKKEIGGIPLLIDAAQTLGYQAFHVDEWEIDFLAFTGHKGLLGPTGVGGLFIRNPGALPPFFIGGTGSRSEDSEMPSFMPDKFEAGTHNIAGIFGLLGALEEPPEAGHSRDDWKRLISGIRQLKNMIFYGAENFDNQGPVFSIKHVKQDCAVLGRVLFDRLRIETRVGLHCAALAHKTLGTFPDGTVRIAPSRYHTGADFDYLLCGLEGIDRL